MIYIILFIVMGVLMAACVSQIMIDLNKLYDLKKRIRKSNQAGIDKNK